jgi:hypothetical protein
MRRTLHEGRDSVVLLLLTIVHTWQHDSLADEPSVISSGRRERARDDPDREASRRLLSLAHVYDAALRRCEPVLRRQGDVVREFTDACRAEGLKAGLYLSPWDRNSPADRDSPRYNDLYADQLTELLTRYGPIAEVWFDGANGEGPNGKRQEYDWPRVFGLVRRLQPNAVMFSDAGPDVRLVWERERHRR